MVLNWCRTSSTMASAALPTDFMVMLLNQYGSMAPMRRPENTCAGFEFLYDHTCTQGMLMTLKQSGGTAPFAGLRCRTFNQA